MTTFPTITPGSLVRSRGDGATLGHVVDVYFSGGEYQVAINPYPHCPDAVPRDYVHRRACDVEVEASL